MKIKISEEQNKTLKDKLGPTKIYCDMDGVLTDFNKAYLEISGEDITGRYVSNPSFWKKIDDAGLEFWENMSWTKDGKELWDFIAKFKPAILSAPSIRKESRIGKQKWVDRELPGTELILRSANRKKELATPLSILIDDREPNIEGWISAGGIGILHTNTKDTIKKLNNLSL